MKLKEARKRAGIGQEKLAQQSGLSLSMIQAIENGRRNGSMKTLMRLADVLDTTPDVLLYGIDNTNSTSRGAAK